MKRRARRIRPIRPIQAQGLAPAVANMSFSVGYWAKLKNVSEATVRRLVARGLVRAVHIGGQIRIYEADWSRYEVSQETLSRL